MEKRRKLQIVIEENGTENGKGFNVYLAGDTERVKAGIADKDMSPAEWWGSKLFQICISNLQSADAVKSVKHNNEKEN